MRRELGSGLTLASLSRIGRAMVGPHDPDMGIGRRSQHDRAAGRRTRHEWTFPDNWPVALSEWVEGRSAGNDRLAAWLGV